MLTQTSYSYDQVKLDALEACMSPERMKSYIAKAKGDHAKAFELYLWNTSLSASLYGPLQALEVSLRNSINRELCVKYGAEWYKNTKPVLFLDNQADRLVEAMKDFDKSRPITVSDVVASVSFGFWTDILHFEMYDELWRQCTHKAFPNRPKGTKRNTIAPIVKRLKDLRNRVAHHEPIWNRDLIKEHDAIIDLIAWIDPITSDWIKQHSLFPSVWSNPRS
jgi:abortive infection bacteriophage resistance protein